MEIQKKIDFTGEELRDAGMALSIESAEQVHENWAEIAYQFLVKYINTHSEFMIEEVRAAAINIVPDPPSKRAWGGVVVRARKNFLISRKGFRNVTNSKAHCTPATLWERL
jgi:hypothetical protein